MYNHNDTRFVFFSIIFIRNGSFCISKGCCFHFMRKGYLVNTNVKLVHTIKNKRYLYQLNVNDNNVSCFGFDFYCRLHKFVSAIKWFVKSRVNLIFKSTRLDLTDEGSFIN